MKRLLAAFLAVPHLAAPAKAEPGFFSRCSVAEQRPSPDAASVDLAWGGFEGGYSSGGSSHFLVENDRVYRMTFNQFRRDAIGQTSFLEGMQRTVYFHDGGRITYRISGFDGGEILDRVFEGECAEVDR